MNLEKCIKCGGIFAWSLMGPVVPGGKEKEEVSCPHCGDIQHSEMTSQFFSVRAATEDEARQWKNKNHA